MKKSLAYLKIYYNWFKPIGIRALLVICGVLIAFGMIEFATGYYLPPPYVNGNGNLWGCHRSTGWQGKPNTTTEINTSGYEHRFITNSSGMHDTEHPIHKADNVFRILVLGDSFVEARQVEEWQTSASVLEESLNAIAPPGLKFEVISAGVSAWGPAQQLMYFRTEGQVYAPDLVLGFWYPANDLSDVLPEHRMTFEGINCYAPYFAMCGETFDTEPWFSAPGIKPTYKSCIAAIKGASNFLNWIYHHSRLYQHLEPLLIKNQPSKAIAYALPFSPWQPDNKDPALAYAYQVTRGIYTSLNDEVQQAGANLALVVAPPKEAIFYELGPPYRDIIEKRYPNLHDANPKLPNQTLTNLMANENVPVFDLQPAIIDHLRAGGGTLYWEKDTHWNVPGNKFVGDLIAKWLIDNHFVPMVP